MNMNYNTDKPINNQEQDLLGRSFFQANQEKQFMNIMQKMDW